MLQNIRRTLLYVPGNNPGMISSAHIYKSDCIMFDLEDSVALSEKDSARFLVHEALKTIDYGEAEKVVRINGLDTEYGLLDLAAVISAGVDVIRLPKAETAEDIETLEKEILRLELKWSIEPKTIKIIASIESAKGVLNAKEIAFASERLVGIALGAEDYLTDLKTTRSKDGAELLFGRSMVLLAARAAKIAAIDTVFSDTNDEEGFRREVLLIKQLGFDGKSIINPVQIKPIHEIYAPTEDEIRKALEIIEIIKVAEEKGSGVISLNGKMVDKPVVERAELILNTARKLGIVRGVNDEF